ncbi:NADH-quinone oxidoreductase subunit NuoE family protein [Nitrospina sp. 32_T5]|uniref:NADH-quinone oxidoreductase subunit NuoE family protein n=1 Tax=unclassified Nitrospina TaxID=2638683 RepID=UPI003F9775BE
MDNPEIETNQEESTSVETAAPEETKICMDKVYEIMDTFPSRSRQFLIPLLTKIQNEFRFLPDEIVEVVMEELNITRAEIYGVISFYPQYRIVEPGKYIFKLCYGTACFVKGAPVIAQKLQEKYGIGKGETDASKLFTLEFASCLGNCGAAPMAIIGEDTHGTIDPEKTYEICDHYKL